MTFSSIKHIHLVGIGGIGMSGIAEILLTQGFSVSGSDLNRSDVTDRLVDKGATVMFGHHAENIGSADVVVYSSAVKPNTNPETKAALEKHIPIIRRAEMLSELSRLKYCLAVAGTHGKTTTTSMAGMALMNAGMDPTVIVGGRLRGLGGSNARLGRGDWIVLEADEYDRSFLQLLPTVAIITNIEADHLDIYSDLDDIMGAFTEFANKVPFYGTACVCLDDAGVRAILPKISKVVLTYGLSEDADVRATNITFAERTSTFTLEHHNTPLGIITLNVPGEHNIRNALAACAAGIVCKAPFEALRSALTEFIGVYRRFEIKGEVRGLLFVDDYAHHPTEVRSTLAAARNGWGRRTVAIFQPHTFTRTRDFAQEFATSFADADVLIVTDIYPAREEPIPGITGNTIAEAARAAGHPSVHYVADLAAIPAAVINLTEPGDMVLTLGAGDIWKVARDLTA